jgi:hypothetical protein
LQRHHPDTGHRSSNGPAAGRASIRRSFEFRTFTPADSAAWAAAFVRFSALLAKAS